MKTQNIRPFQVVYDIQKNRYYRVDKITGEVQLSYRTGKTPAKFDPKVTGLNYLARSRATHSNTIDSSYTDQIKTQHNQNRKHNGQMQNNLYSNNNSTLINSDTLLSRLSYRNELNQKLSIKKRKQYKGIVFSRKDYNSQNRRDQRIKTHALEGDSIILPKLNRRSSQSRIDTQSVSNSNLVPSIFHTIRNSQSNVDSSFVSTKIKTVPKEYSFVDSMNKLNLLSQQYSVSQSRINCQNFQNKLKRYCEIETNKLLNNNFQPSKDNLNNQKLQRFAQKSLLTSVLDQSHLTLNPNSNQGSLNQPNNNRKAITKTQVEHSLNQLSKQKDSLLLLAKKCQQQRINLNQKIKDPRKKQSQPSFQTVDLSSIKHQQNLKCQLQREKQKFLSFYPTNIFKQNPRLIKEQKDRKINLKKLELLYLENNEKKFGKIYRSLSKDASDKIY